MILSASRRTDIPAFYSEWLFRRIVEGYVLVPNPMNASLISRVSLQRDVVDCWVFWSKNPTPMLAALARFDQPWYMQYTLNAYGPVAEARVPLLDERLETFRTLARLAGPRRVVWRYDPIALGGGYDVAFHARQFQQLAAALEGSTDTCVISFLDVYDKTRRNAASLRAPDGAQIDELCDGMSAACARHGMALQSCAEAMDLSRHGIAHGACVDKARIERILGCALKLKGDRQRPSCGCFESVDIGMYDTCSHGCTYCYANRSAVRAAANAARHDPSSPLLIGRPTADDIAKIKDRPMSSCRADRIQISFLDS